MKYYAEKDLSAEKAASSEETRLPEPQRCKIGKESPQGQKIKRALAADRIKALTSSIGPQSPQVSSRVLLSKGDPALGKWGGKRRIKSRREFSEIYTHGKNYTSQLIVLKHLANGKDYSRAAFSVGKRLGKAAARNRARRLMRESLRSLEVKPGWDLLFLSRLPIMKADFPSVKKSMEEVMKRAGILGGIIGFRNLSDFS